MDEVMRNLQSSTEKAEFERFRALPVRMGMAGAYRSKAECDSVKSMWNVRRQGRRTVAKVIQFYIPNNFRKKLKWIPAELRGKIVQFAPPVKKSA